MKKIFASLIFVSVFAAYALYQYFGNGNTAQYQYVASEATSTQNTGARAQTGPAPLALLPPDTTPAQPEQTSPLFVDTKKSVPVPVRTPVSVPSKTKTPTPTPAPTPVPTPAPVPATKPKGQYADGTYTGSVADAYYGNVQVQAVISGGRLVDVAFLQYPNDRRTSVNINSRAMAMLKSEAIQAQSAYVDSVSGASDTTGAFRESLAFALSQAKN